MAPIDFKKIFANRDKYPDTMKFTLGDGAEVSLADLREYDASVGGDLRKELDRQRLELDADRTKVTEAGNRVAQMYVDLEAQRRALPVATTPNADPLAKYAEDEVFRPVVQHMRQIEEGYKGELKSVTEKLDQVVRSISQMGATYMGDKALNEFSSLPANDPVRPPNLTLDSLYKYAVEQGVYDRNKLPDLREAYNKLTSDARHKHEITAAEQRGREAERQDRAENAMLPRPNGGMPALPEGFKPPINMQDAFARAATDKDLWKQINTASGVM
jgi:hypothetical protein